MRGLDGKTAVITGATHGAGPAIALELATRGVKIGAIDTEDVGELLAAIDKAGASGVGVLADLCDREALESAAQEIHRTAGQPLLLVINTTGLEQKEETPLLTMSHSIWQQALTRELTAALNAMQVFCPAMAQRGAGSIVSVSSGAAHLASASHGHESAAQAALVGLTRTLAFELGSQGVRANCVSAMPLMATLRSDRLGSQPVLDPKAVMQPRDVAGVVAFLLSDEASFVTGDDILCDWVLR
jgi:NAD(P)-dependent dehydrogenase (short-subunit alcohol dehydrogenase family)